MRILVTGGAGYIGSHTLVQLISAGHDVLVIDNLSNGHTEVIERVGRLTDTHIHLEVGDIRDKAFLERVFNVYAPDAVIHFAGFKAVAESVKYPLIYYDVNVNGSRVLLEVMETFGCMNIVFSSSATVYGEPHYLPFDETHPVAPVNPYGRTKLMVEQIIEDWCAAHLSRSAISLRYFNPVGAHPSGIIGEDPHDTPNNLMPFIAQVAVGRRSALQIFGDDYDTRDGTGERDYVHVVDLARAHVLALDALYVNLGHEVINIGTGQGVTVKEMVATFESVSGKSIKIECVSRRAGDVAKSYADNNRARQFLGWEAEFGIREMCRDAFVWQSNNPDGFEMSIGLRKSVRPKP